MIALIMAASLLGSVILICVCAPLAPAAPPAPPAPYVFEQDAPLRAINEQPFSRTTAKKAVVPHSLPRPETAAFEKSKAAVFW